MNLQGAGSKTFTTGNFTNNGTVAWQADSGSLAMQTSANVINNGTWDAQGNAALVYDGGTASRFTNNGTLKKIAGSGTTSLTNFPLLAFVNNGTVDVLCGARLPSPIRVWLGRTGVRDMFFGNRRRVIGVNEQGKSGRVCSQFEFSQKPMRTFGWGRIHAEPDR